MVRRALSVVVLALAVLAFLPYHASAQSTSGDVTRRGDVAVGYGFMYDNGTALPLGVLYSEAWRVHPKFDLIGDVGFHHGSSPLGFGSVAINVANIMGGLRFSTRSAFGSRSTEFYQVTAGLTRESLYNVGGSSAFAIAPSTGVEVGLSQRIAIRPQLGVLLSPRSDGSWSGNLNFAVSAVFREHKAKAK
jgi:hypothetical protein